MHKEPRRVSACLFNASSRLTWKNGLILSRMLLAHSLANLSICTEFIFLNLAYVKDMVYIVLNLKAKEPRLLD